MSGNAVIQELTSSGKAESALLGALFCWSRTIQRGKPSEVNTLS